MKTGEVSGKKAKVEEGCCSKTRAWICRNWIHSLLLACALVAIVAAILGSLGACGDDSDLAFAVTPLSIFLAIDASNSMASNMDGTIATKIDTPPYNCNKKKDADGNLNIPGTCYPTPSAVTAVSKSYNVSATGDRVDNAKLAMPQLLQAFDLAMNNGTTGKFQSGVLQWAHDDAGVVLESPLSQDVDVTIAAVQNMVLNGGMNTCWGPGLCQCYSLLKYDTLSADEGAGKLCVLISDGELYSAEMKDHNRNTDPNVDVPIADGSCAYVDSAGRYDGSTGASNARGALKNRTNSAINLTATQGAAQGGFCADVYTDWVADGNSGKMDHKAISDFLKKSNVSIFGTYVGAYSEKAAREMFDTSSCANYTWDAPTLNCPYYVQAADFAALAAKSVDIAHYQRALATVSTETTVSICSLDFLYALLAFVPLLAFLVYRLITIVALKDSMRGRLIKMMANNEIDMDDSAAHDATMALLPNNKVGDIDYAISYMLFSCCPCMLPMGLDELKMVPQDTIHL